MLSADFVEIRSDDLFIVHLMYATTENIPRRNAYHEIGLGNRCFAHRHVVENLEKLRPELVKRDLKLKIFDAYRPPLAHQLLMDRVPVRGLFAETPFRSQHCHGTAVDVCLTDREGKELPYPTRVDAYTAEFAQQLTAGNFAPYQEELRKAAYSYHPPYEDEKTANRALLRQLMEDAGFEAFSDEWWHFNLPDGAKYPLIDFAVDSETGEFIFTPLPDPA